ncbi:hypothetical protein JXB31_00490 [Candidatus Woesearchaeota archaeon]|nr:hypothetical protein [Candidatus Woesearchaeota archaeon]
MAGQRAEHQTAEYQGIEQRAGQSLNEIRKELSDSLKEKKDTYKEIKRDAAKMLRECRKESLRLYVIERYGLGCRPCPFGTDNMFDGVLNGVLKKGYRTLRDAYNIAITRLVPSEKEDNYASNESIDEKL